MSRTQPTATRTGYVRHAANRERDAMHSIRISGTISIHVGPSQIQMIGSAISAKNDQEWPLHNGDQLNGVEVDSLQVAAGPFVSKMAGNITGFKTWITNLSNT